MTGSPYARLDVSKLGLVVGLALLAFGVYTTVTFFRSGGHGMTALRAILAIPLGAVAIYLSFSTVCSGCGARLVQRQLATSPERAGDLIRAASMGDGPGLARAVGIARGEPGARSLRADACPSCRRLVRLRGADGTGVLSGDIARPAADALLAIPDGD